jgi:excisionase family DNA binding protein
MRMAIERRWLKVSEAAEYLGLHPKSVYRACSEGTIPCSKVPGIGVRIDKEELDALLEQEDSDEGES